MWELCADVVAFFDSKKCGLLVLCRLARLLFKAYNYYIDVSAYLTFYNKTYLRFYTCEALLYIFGTKSWMLNLDDLHLWVYSRKRYSPSITEGPLQLVSRHFYHLGGGAIVKILHFGDGW